MTTLAVLLQDFLQPVQQTMPALYTMCIRTPQQRSLCHLQHHLETMMDQLGTSQRCHQAPFRQLWQQAY